MCNTDDEHSQLSSTLMFGILEFVLMYCDGYKVLFIFLMVQMIKGKLNFCWYVSLIKTDNQRLAACQI